MTIALFGGDPLPYAAQVLYGVIAAGFLFSVPGALAGAVPVPPVRSPVLVVAIAVAAAAVAAPTALAARQTLVPGVAAVPAIDLAVPPQLYVDIVARPLSEGRQAYAAAARRLRVERPPAAVYAARIRTEILPTLRRTLESARSVRVDDPRTREVHMHAIRGATLHLLGFELLADAFDRSDQVLQQEANARLADGNAEWEQWAAGVEEL